jgi:hypothetical protein
MIVEAEGLNLNAPARGADIEGAYRRALRSVQGPVPYRARTRAPALAAHEQELAAELGPGQHSGRLENYTRTELCRLLGVVGHEVERLSDEDLRGMALDGHLVPRWRGSPSHLELAGRYARSSHRADEQDEDTAARALRAAMRMPYGDLVSLGAYRTGVHDDAIVPDEQLLESLAERNPLAVLELATEGRYERVELETWADRHGIATTRPDSERHRVAEGAITSIKTPIEMQYDDAFQGFVSQFGGARKLGSIHGELWRDRMSTSPFPRTCLAAYDPQTGDIRLRSDLADRLRNRKGALAHEGAPEELAHDVAVVAHELVHACEGYDEGSERIGMRDMGGPEHALNEGATEALARLHTHDLAERMGLWSSDRGNLRDHALGGARGGERAYRREVEAVVTLAAACCGELDKEKLRAGGYAEPEVLSERAQDWLRDLHMQHGPTGRSAWSRSDSRSSLAGRPARWRAWCGMPSAAPSRGRG